MKKITDTRRDRYEARENSRDYYRLDKTVRERERKRERAQKWRGADVLRHPERTQTETISPSTYPRGRRQKASGKKTENVTPTARLREINEKVDVESRWPLGDYLEEKRNGGLCNSK